MAAESLLKVTGPDYDSTDLDIEVIKNAISHVGDSRFTVDVEVVLTDLIFENLVCEKLGHTIDVIDEYDELAANIDDILQLIDGEIDDR